jgi:hypothetical protein
MVCAAHLATSQGDLREFSRPFWLSPRQVLVVPVAAPYVSPVLESLTIIGVDVSHLALLTFPEGIRVRGWRKAL